MIVMITSDFYSDFELYKTDDLDGLKDLVKLSYSTQDNPVIDADKYQLLCSQDDITTEAALKVADQVLYIGDIEAELDQDLYKSLYTAVVILHKNRLDHLVNFPIWTI